MNLLAPFFMKFIKELRDNLLDISNKLDNVAKESIIENSSEIVLMVKSQLSGGRNSQNLPLAWSEGTGFYSKYTQGLANAEGISIPKKKGSPYNFHWTGETLDNLEMGKIGYGYYEIITSASRMSFLEKIYGEIFDLNEESEKSVNEEIVLPRLGYFLLDNII